MSPHKATWTRYANYPGIIRITPALDVQVHVDVGRIEGGEEEAVRQVQKMEAFLLAAPDMARALVDVRQAIMRNQLDDEGAVEVIERALKKAGVLP